MLGWDIESQKRYHEGARVRTYYRVAHWKPWPPGNIRSEISRLERLRKMGLVEWTASQSDDPPEER